VKKKEALNHRLYTIALAICFLLISTITGFTTETTRDSLEAEKNSGEDKLDFSLELTPADSFTFGELSLSQGDRNRMEQVESQPFVLTDVSAIPSQEQTIQAPPRISNLQNYLYTSSVITLTALNVADYLTTVRALKHKELEEANPAMKSITKNIYIFTAVKLGVAALDIYLLKKLYKKNKPLAWVLSVAANFAMSYVVANNVRMIKGVQ
jgi:hypothetical protein